MDRREKRAAKLAAELEEKRREQEEKEAAENPKPEPVEEEKVEKGVDLLSPLLLFTQVARIDRVSALLL